MDAVEFSDWVAPHAVVLHAVAIRQAGLHAADDLVQDALVRAWRRRSTYRTDRGQLGRGSSRFRIWTGRAVLAHNLVKIGSLAS